MMWLVDLERFLSHEVMKVAHYDLSVNAMTGPMQVRDNPPPYGDRR